MKIYTVFILSLNFVAENVLGNVIFDPHAYPCKEPPRKFSSCGQRILWFFDETSSKCLQKIDDTCPGFNRFETRDECEYRCIIKKQKEWEVAYDVYDEDSENYPDGVAYENEKGEINYPIDIDEYLEEAEEETGAKKTVDPLISIESLAHYEEYDTLKEALSSQYDTYDDDTISHVETYKDDYMEDSGEIIHDEPNQSGEDYDYYTNDDTSFPIENQKQLDYVLNQSDENTGISDYYNYGTEEMIPSYDAYALDGSVETSKDPGRNFVMEAIGLSEENAYYYD